MSWDYYVLRGSPGDLASERVHALGALDPRVVAEVLGGSDVWTGATLVAELDAAPDVDGVVRYAGASVRFDDVAEEELERQRAEYADLLGRLVTLAERTGGRVWDPQREAYVSRSDVARIASDLDRREAR